MPKVKADLNGFCIALADALHAASLSTAASVPQEAFPLPAKLYVRWFSGTPACVTLVVVIVVEVNVVEIVVVDVVVVVVDVVVVVLVADVVVETFVICCRIAFRRRSCCC